MRLPHYRIPKVVSVGRLFCTIFLYQIVLCTTFTKCRTGSLFLLQVKYANTQLQGRINEICDIQQNLDATLSGVDKMYFDGKTLSMLFTS